MLIFAYGAVCYVLFLATFLYAIGFVESLFVPTSLDSGVGGPVGQAVLINVAILGLFAVQHTIMARPAFKKWWTRFIPQAAERSTFVLATCAILILLFWQWRPITGVVWQVQGSVLRAILYGVSLGGWGLVLYSSFLIDHFDLFGLRQVYLHLRRQPYSDAPFKDPWLYQLVRNPLMLGFLIAFWFAPVMTYGHLLFAGVVTGYVFVGIWFEERDIAAKLGEPYRRYRARTSMLLPLPRRRSEVAAEATESA